MADMLDKGSAFLRERLTAHVSRTVTYVRGATEFELSATLGQSVNMESNEEGFVIYKRARDFIVSTEALYDPVALEYFTPEAGHRIKEGTDPERVYEVAATNGDEVWRYTDRYHRGIRIHTVQTETNSV